MKTLFGDNPVSKPTTIRIDIFHDERILHKQGWLYHVMLFVPVGQVDWLINELMQRRAGYDGFLHFRELRNPAALTPQGMKSHVAKEWIKFFAEDTRRTRCNPHHNNFCANVVGINRNNLNPDCFGDKIDRNIFNRFFRTTLLSGVRRFYGGDFQSISIRHVFHGTSDLGADDPLRWHPMWRIERDSTGDITFEREELTLVAADHRQEGRWPSQSQIIQFGDIILGAASQCLDFSSSRRGQCDVAEEMMPVMQRLTKNPNNPNSRYFRKYAASFFPSKKLSLADLGTAVRYTSGFYTKRGLKFGRKDQALFPF